MKGWVDGGRYGDLFMYGGEGDNMLGGEGVELYEGIRGYFEEELK